MKKFTTLAKLAAVFLLGSAAFSANAQTEIVPGESFYVDSVDPVWVYTPIVDVPNFYFTVNDFEYDVFEDVEPWGPGLVFATDQNGENPIELTPVKKANGEYVYTGTNLEVGTNYYMILKDQYSTFGMTLYLEEYVPEEQPDYTPISVGEPFTLSPADQYYKYFSLSEEDFYLVTNSDVNLLNGGLVINYQNMNVFADYMQVEAVETEDGYVYTGLYAQSLENYEFIYSGTETIEMTLYTGTYSGDSGEGPGEPEVKFPEIVPGEKFFVDSDEPVWVYTPTEDVANFYITVEDFEFNVFEEDLITFSTDAKGMMPVPLTAESAPKGEFVYLGTNLEAGHSYYIVLKDEYSGFNLALYTEEYVPAEQPDYKPIAEGEAFTLSPADQYYKYFSLSEEDFYLVTNSDVNLLNGGLVINYQGMNIFADYMQVEAVETEDGYVYTGLYAQSLENYEFIYSGTETIEMTLYTGTYGGGSGEPEVSFPEIVPGEKFFVDSDEPVWVYTPTENVANFYITVDDFEFNVFEDDLITFSTDAKGMMPVPLTAESAPKGEFVYLGTDLEAGQSYYIVLKDEYSGFNLALYTEEYVPAEQPDYKSITVGEAFTLSPADQYYKYFSLSEEDFYLVTNSDVNLLEGGLVINYQGMNVFADWMQVEAIETEEGYVYTGLYAQSLENYEFVYSGTETIEMTLYTGTYGGGSSSSDYMENYADQYTTVINADDPYSAVELSWGVDVTLIADQISVPVWYNGDIKGILTAEYFQLQGGDAGNPGISAAAETGDNGTVLFILTGASELFTDPGTYLMTIPEGLFADAEGNVNKEQDVVVTVIAYVEGSSEQDGTEFAQGEDVTIVIDFDEEVTINEDNAEEFAILVTNYMDYDELIALDADNVEISGNQIIINLGNELPLGFYELSLREGVVLSGDNPNAGTYVYFSVAEGGTDGIFGLNAEELKNAAIYNLNGVRVDANKLTKGIYIINGKKVLVK